MSVFSLELSLIKAKLATLHHPGSVDYERTSFAEYFHWKLRKKMGKQIQSHDLLLYFTFIEQSTASYYIHVMIIMSNGENYKEESFLKIYEKVSGYCE